MPDIRTQTAVIDDIVTLVSRPGYVYALCMILFEDFHINVLKSGEINYRERISTKEAAFILGLLIKKEIDFSHPNTPQDLIAMKIRTYELLEELHSSFSAVFIKRLKENFERKEVDQTPFMSEKEFFGTGDMLTEPIFYSGTGVYDVQFLDFLSKKYAQDAKWLSDNRSFDSGKAKEIVIQIKKILQKKSERVRLVRPKDRLPEVREKFSKELTEKEWEKETKELIPMLEIYQYVDLFFDYPEEKRPASMDEIREEGWASFYKGLIELFVVRPSDFDDGLKITDFFQNFTITPGNEVNKSLVGIGDYNEFSSHPVIKLDTERYFVPVSFLVFEAIYESPFYWMVRDESYFSEAAKHRGEIGEQLTYDFLVKVFGKEKTFKSVKIKSLKNEKSTKRREDKTDIDILCVLGSKALCVQVKSKKLTELSKKGSDEALAKDFKAAVQDAYEQGKIARTEILNRQAQFVDENDRDIVLSEAIDEVYIMGLTTENYPSLTHQAITLLEKEESDPSPIFLTIFDLELLAHYLNDPYDFLYYIRQRILLAGYFRADEEIVFLGYHLTQKLWRVPNVDGYAIDNSLGQLIDRNYYPYKIGIDVPPDGDKIANRWKSDAFKRLCDQIKTLDEPKITDAIFHLYDLSSDAIENLMKYILDLKDKTKRDGKAHNFSMPPGDKHSPRVGFTYQTVGSMDFEELAKRLTTLVHLRKYKSKGDIWIGLGSVKDSERIIDSFLYAEGPWEYNKETEDLANEMLEGAGGGHFVRLGKKVGRNEKCPCGSRLKYKKCCGS